MEAVTDASGARLATLAYDPFGARRKPDWTRSLNSSEVETLADDLKLKVSRGYSDHEHLDRAGFVHMNGRVYDPRTGRFLSPDPVVENPAFSQSWHSYSYVANSPLSLADPTGLFAQCPIPTLGFSCDPAASPGGFGGAIDTVFSLIHRYWFDFYVYRAPSFSFAIGDEGIDVEFDVVDLIGVAVSVASEIVRRDVRFEGKGEADDPSDTTPPIARVAKRMQAAAAAARRAAVLDERSSHEGFRTYLGCRRSDYVVGHCYVVITEDGAIHRQYSVSGSRKFLPQDSKVGTFEKDREAFKDKQGEIFEIDPPEGVTREEFKEDIIYAAEAFAVDKYRLFTSNSNAAAGFVILFAGGRLPDVQMSVPGLRHFEEKLTGATPEAVRE